MGSVRILQQKAPHRAGLECLTTRRGEFEGLVLAETEGFEPSMRLYTAYSLSRTATMIGFSLFFKDFLIFLSNFCPNGQLHQAFERRMARASTKR